MNTNIKCCAAALVAACLATAGYAQSQPRMTPAERSKLEYRRETAQAAIEQLQAERFDQCIDGSPLNSRRKECHKKQIPISDLAMHSSNNCIQYYARGTRELLECQASSYERAYESLRDGKPYSVFEAPDGSTKSRVNTFKKI